MKLMTSTPMIIDCLFCVPGQDWSNIILQDPAWPPNLSYPKQCIFLFASMCMSKCLMICAVEIFGRLGTDIKVNDKKMIHVLQIQYGLVGHSGWKDCNIGLSISDWMVIVYLKAAKAVQSTVWVLPTSFMKQSKRPLNSFNAQVKQLKFYWN